MIPFGGYVKIPGMHRPAPSDLDVHFGPALYEEPRLLTDVERAKRLVAQGAFDETRAAPGNARPGARERQALAEGTPRSRPRAERARRRPGPGRLLAAADVEAHRRDRGRARHEPGLRRRPARRRLHARHPVRRLATRPGRDPEVAGNRCGATGRRRDRRRQPPADLRLHPGSRRDPQQQGRPARDLRRAQRPVQGAQPGAADEDGRRLHARLPPGGGALHALLPAEGVCAGRKRHLARDQGDGQLPRAHRERLRAEGRLDARRDRAAVEQGGAARISRVPPGPRRDQPLARPAEPAAAAAARRRPHAVLDHRGRAGPRGRSRGLRAGLRDRHCRSCCCSSSWASRTTSGESTGARLKAWRANAQST